MRLIQYKLIDCYIYQHSHVLRKESDLMELLINQETLMTYLNSHLLSFFSMISGILLMLLFPQWLTYVVLTSLVFTALAYAHHRFPEKFKLALIFCTEFLSFCLMLALFIAFIIGLGIVFT